jgi:hypothetical protein
MPWAKPLTPPLMEIASYFVCSLQEEGFLKTIPLPVDSTICNALLVSETVHLHVCRRSDSSSSNVTPRIFALVASFRPISCPVIAVHGSFVANGAVLHLVEVASNND